jgi:hypothetical protein
MRGTEGSREVDGRAQDLRGEGSGKPPRGMKKEVVDVEEKGRGGGKEGGADFDMPSSATLTADRMEEVERHRPPWTNVR